MKFEQDHSTVSDLLDTVIFPACHTFDLDLFFHVIDCILKLGMIDPTVIAGKADIIKMIVYNPNTELLGGNIKILKGLIDAIIVKGKCEELKPFYEDIINCLYS